MKAKRIIIPVLIIIIGAAAIFAATKIGNNGKSVATKSAETTQKSQAKEILLTGQDGKNVLELLKASHEVETEDSSLGTMVKSIDGLASDNNNFWLYSVNEQSASMAADKYVTKAGDKIKWEYKGFN